MYYRQIINSLICCILHLLFKNTDDVRQFRNFIKFRLYRKNSYRERIILADYSDVRFGLADRITGILSLYMLAKERKRQFKIYHTCEFLLEDYLEPSEYNWLIDKDDIAYGLNESRPIISRLSRSYLKTKGLPELSDRILQYHAYTNHDFREYVSDNVLGKYDRHKLFHELFRPSARLSKLLYDAWEGLGFRPYIAVHFRFMNFFETVERNAQITEVANVEAHKDMLAKCRKHLIDIHSSNPDKLLLIFSDSRTFVKEVNESHLPYVKSLPGVIGHVSALHENKTEIVDKAFLDLMMMARAEFVVSVIGENMRKSGFCRIAAEIGGIAYVTRDDSVLS